VKKNAEPALPPTVKHVKIQMLFLQIVNVKTAFLVKMMNVFHVRLTVKIALKVNVLNVGIT
jgi:hypothetical protein